MTIRTLPKALQDKAKIELNEIPSKIEENLENLKAWLFKQEHIKWRNDDQFLVNFLRASKYSLERAKEKLNSYYVYRTLAPEIARNLDPLLPAVQTYIKQGTCVPIPVARDYPTYPRIGIIRLRDYDPDELTPTIMLKAISIMMDVLLNDDDHLVVCGISVIWDMKGIHFKTAAQLTPRLINQTIFLTEKASPFRLKAVYIINVPIFFEPLLNVGKALVSKKLANRLYFYSTNNLEEIYNTIPKSTLPNEYGGNAGSLNDLAAEWKETIESHRDRLLNEDNYYTDESKRPGKQYTDESIFGVDGSFRKLEID